jgi:predicted DNA-binding protein
MEKKATSIRLTPEGLRLLVALAKELGVTQSSALEIAIRDLAKRRGVT